MGMDDIYSWRRMGTEEEEKNDRREIICVKDVETGFEVEDVQVFVTTEKETMNEDLLLTLKGKRKIQE